ncbi:S9 family peptidase [Fluviicola taffensis]|uniref:Putative peptidase n=1 Tax=Fluviicola taffensis (strain DSM 16823 / NCIMB 13979 / RW262) TaxID=755732 RepID=F2IJL2_FLUTR|nr:S9 family peptidase [Fluviicola taffensis]AEA42900.1 putative peptidase [Fluviicola taffensis DSM 16823]
MGKLSILFALFLSAFARIQATAQEFTPEKMSSLNRISGTLGSPNEEWMVYQSSKTDYTQNKSKTITYLVELKTGKSTILAIDGAWNFAWTSDNKLTFLQSNGSEIQLQKLNPSTKEVNTLHQFGVIEVEGITLSSDGKRFATLEPLKIKETIQDKYPDLPQTTGRLETDLMYRHWNQWSTPTVLHLYWYESSTEGKFTKKGDVMQGENFPSVTGPFGGIESICFSKDGQTIYYSTKKMAGKNFAQSTNSEIYAFHTSDKITTTLSSAHKGYDTNPAINFTGKSLAWLSMEKDGFEADKNRIRIMDLASRQEKDLTASLDLSVNDFTWHPSKEIIYFTATVKATKQLYSLDVVSGKILQLTSDRCDYVSFSVMKDRILLERQDMIHPTDIWIFTPKTGLNEQLTHANKEELNGIAEPTVQEKWITTTDGKKMLTWVVFPPNYDPAKKYPTLLYCQGGPQSPVSQYFSYRWNFRLMASQGYIVVAPNRRGLPGFGQEWNDAISKDWGGQAMRDYLTAIDSCVAQIPAINKDKLGAVGASYGGYSVYYLAGIHENRFKAFISHCGLFNLESWYGTTEELFFANWDIGGPYWLPENKELYAKNSPHKLVDKWNTPMLVIHGGKDFRVPESEGMQAFQVLQLKGIPSKYLYFPDEGHWVTKPQNSILWNREFYDWLNTYLK